MVGSAARRKVYHADVSLLDIGHQVLDGDLVYPFKGCKYFGLFEDFLFHFRHNDGSFLL